MSPPRAKAEPPLLELQNLSLGYGEDQPPVLEGLSLQLQAGSILVLLGPSGCGKSSLLNLLAGFVPPRSGRALIRGRPLAGPGADRGLVFQDEALLPWLDVLGNIALPLRLQGQGRLQREARARELLGLVGLAGAEQRRLWELSGGMRQRVALARALAADPDILLMDEPFGALDALTREQMQELLLRVWATTGKTLVLVTHEVEEAVFLATDLLLLSAGPARIAQRLTLDFSRRLAAGEGARALKSAPEFVAVREQVLARVRGEAPAREVAHEL